MKITVSDIKAEPKHLAYVEGVDEPNEQLARGVHDFQVARGMQVAVDYYRATYGVEPAHREVVERDGVEEVLLRVAESYIQLLTPVRDDSPVAKYLEKKGEGIHHVAYRVDDCAAALDRVKREGHQVIDEAPRPGSRGTTVAFVHPKTAFGTLVELVQE